MVEISEQPEKFKKRAVAFERKISDVKKEDIRVKVAGKIIEKEDSSSSILIEDGVGNKMRVLLDESLYDNQIIGSKVRVIGLVIPALQGNEIEIKGEVIQDFSKVDLQLYDKYLSNKKL